MCIILCFIRKRKVECARNNQNVFIICGADGRIVLSLFVSVIVYIQSSCLISHAVHVSNTYIIQARGLTVSQACLGNLTNSILTPQPLCRRLARLFSMHEYSVLVITHKRKEKKRKETPLMLADMSATRCCRSEQDLPVHTYSLRPLL
jgi:hypothetical protein